MQGIQQQPVQTYAVSKDNRLSNIYGALENKKGALEKILGDSMPVEKFFIGVLSAFRNNALLCECDDKSIVTSVYACAQTGLIPNTPQQHVFMVPYGKTCTIVIGYQGLMELMYRTGRIDAISAEIVYEGDEFEYEYGTNEFIRHRPKPLVSGEQRVPIYAYCYVRVRSTSPTPVVVFTVMSVDEIKAIQSKSKSQNIWKSHWSEMAKKTVVRRIAKLLPKSIEHKDLAFALRADSIDTGEAVLKLNDDMTDVEAEYLNS
jgi:recombination protein RecT